MLKRGRWLISLLLALMLVSPVLAQGPVVQHSDPNWQASYWNNTTLSGSPVLQRSEGSIDYDWGGGSPDGQVHQDQFSARWTRYIEVSPGTYRFTATSDDGMRVWVDGELIISQWYDHVPLTAVADRYLGSGHHQITVEYYENTGSAVAKLYWSPSSGTITNWRGEYFNNTSLGGSPALVRDDAEINFNWGTSSPASGTIGADKFSVRWTRDLNLAAGTYHFEMTVDDGGRLWVNNSLLIDSWKDQARTTYAADIYLSGGSVPVKMEYYENMQDAYARLVWTGSGGAGPWRGEYFNNTSLSGGAALVRNDTDINFNWGAGSPASGTIGADKFSVRWTRDLSLAAGMYRFTTTTDDGVRLWVNGHLLIDAWWDQSATAHSGDLYLPGSAVSIKMEYYENMGDAVARLSWGPGGGPVPGPGPVPGGTVIVDETDAGFSKGGAAGSWRVVYEGYGNRLLWTRNNDWARYNYNWARWYPSLVAGGRYEVFVYVPDRYTTTGSATYWVSHRDGLTKRIVSQSANGNRWVSLGTYYFAGSSKDYVSLSDVTGEARLTRLIAFDAMKWEPR